MKNTLMIGVCGMFLFACNVTKNSADTAPVTPKAETAPKKAAAPKVQTQTSTPLLTE